ncbi:hypothetical protein [Microcystis sp. M57BS1]|nr:hypothetical protein [Microcystis sp. M57BS1]
MNNEAIALLCSNAIASKVSKTTNPLTLNIVFFLPILLFPRQGFY